MGCCAVVIQMTTLTFNTDAELEEQGAPTFTEPCKRCRGKGVRFFGRPVIVVQCNTCKGEGVRHFKAPAEKRAKTNEKAKERKAKKISESIAAFQIDHPRVWQWMETSSFEFAGKMKEALLKYGSLTERQLAASIKCAR